MSTKTLSLGAALKVPSPPLWVATDTLRDWLARSAELGVPAEEQTFAGLAPLGRHWLLGAHGAQHGSRRLAVAELDLQLADGERRTGYLPLPYREFRAAVQGASDRDPVVWLHGLGAAPAPDWAGAPSFGRVHHALAQIAQANTLLAEGRVALDGSARLEAMAREATRQPAAVLSTIAERWMREATPIVIEPELLAGLPSFDDAEEAFRYGSMVTLPFRAVYLDTAGADGAGAHIRLQVSREREVDFRLLGGLVWPERDGVSVLAFGRPTGAPDPSGRPDFYGRVLFGVKSALFPLAPGTPTRIRDERFELQSSMLSVPPLGALLLRELAGGEKTRDAQRGLLETLALGSELEGEVQLGGTGATGQLAGSANPDELDFGVLARVITQISCELLGVFYFLDIEGVQIAPVSLPRYERREAAREHRPLARTAVIQPGLAPRDGHLRAPEPGGEHTRLSYRFFVRGHYRHHRPGHSRVADARPDLVRPCPKPGCGACRRIPVAGHWKGPAEGPVILKTRILKARSPAPDGA